MTGQGQQHFTDQFLSRQHDAVQPGQLGLEALLGRGKEVIANVGKVDLLSDIGDQVRHAAHQAEEERSIGNRIRNIVGPAGRTLFSILR